MKDVCMLLVLAATVWIGYVCVKKLDDLLNDNLNMFHNAASQSRQEVRITAETPRQLKDISSALQYCSDAFPYIDFSCKCDSEMQILHKLEDQKLDIAILGNVCEDDIPACYRAIHIIYHSAAHGALQDLLSEEAPAADDMLMVWNPAILSTTRDRVLLMIENQNHCEAVV